MSTDREIFKNMQKGQFTSNNTASSPLGEVAEVHKRQRDCAYYGTENAATNVAEMPICVVKRKSTLREARLLVPSNVTTHNTNYDHIKIYKRTSAGASQTLIAQWNTHGGAQGTIVTTTSNNCSINTTSAANECAAGSVISYEIIKASSGTAVPVGTVFSLDFEEV